MAWVFNPFTGNLDRVLGTHEVTNSILRESAALSVIGRSANSQGDVADISAGTDHQVLRRSGTSLGFGSVNLAQAAAVTGTLPVGNGGTGATSWTQGSVVFATSTTTLGQDNAEFFWNTTSKLARVGPTHGRDAKFALITNSDSLTLFEGWRFCTPSNGAGFIFGSAGGTAASPSQTGALRTLGGIDCRGYHNGGAFTTTKALVAGIAAEAFTSTGQGTHLVIQSTPTGGTTAGIVGVFSQAANLTLSAGLADPSAGTRCLILSDGTAPSGMSANTAGFYAEADGGGNVEPWAIAEDGTSAQLAPHGYRLFTPDAAEPMPLPDLPARNPYLGLETAVDLTKLARLVETLTGQTLVYTHAIATRDWVSDQTALVERQKTLVEAWEARRAEAKDPELIAFLESIKPATPAVKDPSAWILSRVRARDATYDTRMTALKASLEAWKASRPARVEGVRT